MYLLNDHTEVTKDQIKAAFEQGKARLVHGRKENSTSTTLMLDGKDFDTRGQCVSMWEETWTRKPDTLADCLNAARI